MSYINENIKEIERITPQKFCDMDMLNLLLSHFATIAHEQKINYNFDVRLPENIPLSNIELCDDNQAQLEHIENILKEYRTPVGEKIFVDVFHNALDIISAMKKTEYDALLLDIIMPGFSGIDAARDIRIGNRIPLSYF